MTNTTEQQPQTRKATPEVQKIHNMIVEQLELAFNFLQGCTMFYQGRLIDEDSTAAVVDFYACKKYSVIDEHQIDKVTKIAGVSNVIISAHRDGHIPKGASSLRIRLVIDSDKYTNDKYPPMTEGVQE